MLHRRAFTLAGLSAPALAAWAQPSAADLLREGGVVLALRHALAPGTFDPPGFKLGDCCTQRNLSDDGRAQARAMGAWFRAQGLQPAQVLSSPWCRCVDTAELAFGRHEAWAALGSPRGATEGTNSKSLQTLRRGVQQASGQRGRFTVWVTHMFVLADLVGQNTAVGEGLLLRADGAGVVQVLGRWTVA